jgi:hypothetical protein
MDGATIPVHVETPVTINGRIFPREDIDEWSFQGTKGRTIRVEVTAARLGSPLDSQIEIRDAVGRRLAVNSDHFGADSFLLFTPPADGEYRVRIFDAAYGGLQTYVYRLTLSDRPHVLAVYPLGGRRGSKTDFELSGLGVDGKKQTVALPVAAANSVPTSFKIDAATTNGVYLETSDADELLEAEPNDAAEKTATLTAPCVANGRIDRAGDFDLWGFDGMKGEILEFDLHAAALGSSLDSVLSVIDADGTELGNNDDASTTEPDSRLRFTPPSDGRYWVRVADRSPNRGGPTFAYRLHTKKADGGDFRLSLAVDAASVDRNATTKYNKVSIARYGFSGEIRLVIDNLPAGVTFSPDKLPNGRNEVSLQFKANDGLPIALYDCTVRGVAKIGDEEVSRTATVTTAIGEPTLATLHLAVSMPTPFAYSGSLTLPYAQRGTYFTRRFVIERNGFTGPIEVRPAERQMRHLQGVQGGTVHVPAGADEFDYSIYLPTFLELGRTSRTIMTLVGEVPDEQGLKHKVSYTSPDPQRQIALIIGPGPLSIEADPATVMPATESPVDVAIQLDRDAAAMGPVKLELVVPRHIHGATAEPIMVAAGGTEGTLRIRFAADAGPFNAPLTVRAEHGAGLERVVAETTLEVVAP